MAYTISEIINWSKICQPLARIGEAKRLAKGDTDADPDLDIKLYITRKDVEYAYAQNADADVLHIMGNYLLMLCGRYLFEAQVATGGGSGIAPITPVASINTSPLDWIVSAAAASANAPLSEGDDEVYFNGANGYRDFRGYQTLNFYRGGAPQYTTDPGNGGSWYEWNSTTGYFKIYNTAAQLGEQMRITV
jgi:hypothetical protein